MAHQSHTRTRDESLAPENDPVYLEYLEAEERRKKRNRELAKREREGSAWKRGGVHSNYAAADRD